MQCTQAGRRQMLVRNQLLIRVGLSLERQQTVQTCIRSWVIELMPGMIAFEIKSRQPSDRFDYPKCIYKDLSEPRVTHIQEV